MSETLRQKQSRFVRMVARLLLHAEVLGFEITFGDAYRDPRCDYGSEVSLHRSRLAIDLNLFKGGKYLSTTEDHLPLGLYWESIGGAWGGRFEDGNHYSLEHQGRK
jgi:hypothetical protein